MRYFVYCRKSTDREDRQTLSTEAQKRLLLEHAAAKGLAIVDVYVENQTAYKAGRPLFNAMLERLAAGQADGILAYHLTRLARNSYDGGRLIYMMDERSVVEIATPEKAYTGNADDKFMMQIHFAMAKKSSDDTSQFVRRDVESKLLRGEYPGMVPIGYLNITRDGHISRAQDDPQKYLMLLDLGRPLRRVEVDPIDGPLVKKLFAEAAKGIRTLPQLRRLSFQLGLRARTSGKIISKNAIRILLTNPYYRGVISYNGAIYDDDAIREKSGNVSARIQHEPLVSRPLFDRVQQAVFGERRGRYRKLSFAFGGCVLRCGECGSPITAEVQKGHAYYHCTKNKGECAQSRWTREDSLDRQFSEMLARLHIPASFLEYGFGKLRQAHKTHVKFLASRRMKLQTQANDCQRRLDALLQLKISAGNAGGILLSDEEYLAQKTAIRRELEEIKEHLVTAQGESDGWLDDCERFFDFTQHLAKRFPAASIEAKKTYLRMICSNFTLKDRILAAEYQEPYAALAAFPLAVEGGGGPSEPDSSLADAENPQLMDSWLDILTRIRTYPLLPYALQLAAA